jgi:phage shock protein E
MRLAPFLATLAAPLFAAAFTGLSACTPRPAANAARDGGAGPPAPGIVSGAVARELAEGGARVIDVRTAGEFAEGHVPGAVNIPFDQLGARAAELGDPARPVVLYCRTGRRSGLAAGTLRGLGFEKVYDFQRYSDWPAAR